ncbi:MAG: helix-turn-helix transcriptional regulator [Angelakisella sp.]
MIGARLTELRKKAGLSQRELGAKLDVSHYTISAYEKERSEPGDQIKVRLSELFNVSSDYLLGLINTPLPVSRSEVSIKVPPTLTVTQQQLLQQFIQELGKKR